MRNIINDGVFFRLIGAIKSTKDLNLKGGSKKTISNAVKRRAQAIIEDRSIDAESRVIIRYGLDINDPCLPELVRRIGAGETIIEKIVVLKHPNSHLRFRKEKDRSVDRNNLSRWW